MTLYDHFKSFLKFKEAENILQSSKIIKDEKNGYIKVQTETGASTSEYAFVYWLKEDKTKLFGYSESTEGIQGNTYKTSFWIYDSGKWKEKNDALPKITLKDFLSETEPIPSEAYGNIQYSYVLPQIGTTIKVLPMPYSELSIGEIIGEDKPVEFNYEKYICLLNKKKYTSIELIWNKKNGLFRRGAKTLAKSK